MKVHRVGLAQNAEETPAKDNSHGSKAGVFQNVFKEFAQRSTIHGLPYLGDQKLHHFERFWWFLLLIVSIVGSTIFIHRTYEKWNENPIIISLATKPTSVWHIPFPAITICPQKKIKSEYLNTTDVIVNLFDYQNATTEELRLLETIFQLLETTLKAPIDVQNVSLSSNDLTEMMKKIAPTPGDTIASCISNVYTPTCGRTVLTANGVCFSVNMLNARDLYREGIIHNDEEPQEMEELQWTRDGGFIADQWIDTRTAMYPYRSYHHPSVDAMKLVLKNYKEFIQDREPYQTGYTFLLHAPDDVPNFHWRTYQRSIRDMKDVTVLIIPKVITTTNELRSYRSERRSCYYTDERYLKFYKIYTQNNCELECLTNFTLTYCGCVKFSMPRVATTDICGIPKIDCVREASMIYFAPTSKNASSMSRVNNCNCLPSCTQITYSAEVTSAVRHFIPKAVTDQFRMFFTYKSPTFEAAVRSENFGMSDFVAGCGGLLGLFMGISVLSVLEIVYFFTIHLIVNVKKK
ncbi:pickpocket protein 28-like [Bradysia coprophila]|uniref:pickpocket protein 28-like n=1 Tax=Bradysia coprophila TaxID=38358 RepID=UPI00187D8DC4|nr:pickpocket protein 28-like [Bradysia coprophila]